jgi:hypothetical protein
MSTGEWLAKYQGAFIKAVGFVWHCGDDCECSQAQIIDYYTNKAEPRWSIPVTRWEGEFYSGGEGDPKSDLSTKRAEMLASDADAEAIVEWL